MALVNLAQDAQSAKFSFKDDRLEDTKHLEVVTEVQLLNQRHHTEEHRKALKNWTLLRDSIKNVSKAIEQADLRETVLVHGIHHDRKLNHAKIIKHAIFIPQRKV